MELLEKKKAHIFLAATSASHFNAPQASVLARTVMRSAVSGFQQRRKEKNLRLRAAEVIRNVLMVKQRQAFVVQYGLSRRFTGAYRYGYHGISDSATGSRATIM